MLVSGIQQCESAINIHSLLSVPPELHLSSLVPLNEVHFFRNVQGLCSNFMSVVKYLLLRGFPWLPYLKQAFLSVTLRFLTFSFFLSLFVYLLLAVLGLHCCAQALSSCHELGLLLVAVPWLSIVVASRFGVPFSIWDPPRLGSELVSPALAVDS